MVSSSRSVEQRDWVRAHEALSQLAQQRAAADAEEGRCLLAALRAATHVHLGYGSFTEYVERMCGYRPRTTQEKLRVAEALERLPRLLQGLESGSLSWSAVRELTRVAVPETERAWLDMASGKSLRQLEELLVGKAPGDDPHSPSDPALRRNVLRFEVAPETLALFREALGALRRSAGTGLDDDAALLTMARQVLGGPRDEGRASYQIALTVCSQCGAGAQHTTGELVPIGNDVVAMAQCDAQQLGHVAVQVANDNPGEQHPLTPPLDAHVGAATHASAPQRAKQTIPPARRRAVLLRDHRCCVVPGCKNSRYVDVHHLQLRSENGGHHAENLITLCSAHHRATHRGEFLIDGKPTTGLRFRHADGSDYGRVSAPLQVDAQAKVFSALRGLGFREAQARAALSQLRRDPNLRNAPPERLLRAALQALTRPASELARRH